MVVTVVIVLGLLAVLYFFAHYNFWRSIVDDKYPRILMYHSINKADNNISNELVVSPNSFEKQLAYLVKKGFRFVTVSELLEQDNCTKCVALTFDDGFSDNYTEAYSLLKKYGAKATIYLAPEITDIDRLTPSMIKEMQNTGIVEFGAHTLSHCNLSKVTDEKAKYEIFASKSAVETLTGSKCEAFAYPYGRYSDSTVELVKEAGYSSAVTVKKGIGPLTDRFRMKRVSILGSTNIIQFHLAITRGRYRV